MQNSKSKSKIGELILIVVLIIMPFYLAFNLYFLDKYYFLCPIEYNGNLIIRSDSRGKGYFGAPRSGNRLHQGIDLLAEIGTPVLAVGSGRVLVTKYTSGMGNYVIIRHSADFISIYGHLSKIDVRKNGFLRQGGIIGRLGKTGNANHRGILPHLHFEIRKDGVPQDPLGYLQ